MKYKKELFFSLSCFLFAFLLTMVWVRGRNENLAARISPEILRFHVLANSNANKDQQLKLEVKSLLVELINQELPKDAGKDETCTYISTHADELEDVAEEYMRKAGYDYPAKVELTSCYFPTKAYGDMVFPCGIYDAAQVTIGAGRGRNWWCVLYPQLCFVNASYAKMPEDSKALLEASLEPSDYQALLHPAKRVIDFKFLDLLNLS